LKKSPNDDSFFLRVYEVTKLIPEGRVTSYGAIARYIGAPGASRMVGWALNNCHTFEEPIPAHRVVNRNGLLTGKHHFRHNNLMQELLESEGIEVDNDRVVRFNELFWDPNKELN
jgi:methylated-DNA-protein-cysteine methyltransferase-like protein